VVVAAVVASGGHDDTPTVSVAPSTTAGVRAPTTPSGQASASTAASSGAAPAATSPAPPATAASPTGNEAGEIGTREHPVPLGQPGVLKDADNGDLSVTVSSADLSARAAVAAANQFNPPPAAGEYAIVNLSATYQAGKRKQTSTLLESVSFSVFGSAGVEHPSAAAVAPAPQLDVIADLLPGGTVSGNEVFEYEPGTAPLLRVEETFCFTNCDTLWFALN
jgi:hypothetical protein